MRKLFASALVALPLALCLSTAHATSVTTIDKEESVRSEDSIRAQLTPEEQTKLDEYLKLDERENKWAKRLQIGGTLGPEYKERTANGTPSHDTNIGALFWVKTGWFRDQSKRSCTASHIGGRWWLTARHCVIDRYGDSNIGFIETSDGDFAGIERWWTMDSRQDIALIRVGTGLTHQPSFSLASKPMPMNTRFSVNGFGIDHPYSSKSDFIKVDEGTFQAFDEDNRYYDQTEGDCVGDPNRYRTIEGDSGGPGYIGSTQYLVLSGSERIFVHGPCRSYFADVTLAKKWIEDKIKDHDYSSYGDRADAFQGGLAAKYSERIIQWEDTSSSGQGSS